MQKNSNHLQHINVIDKPVDAIDMIHQKSLSGYENDVPLYICNISDIVQNHQIWKSCMPRVHPFYAVRCNDDPIVIQTLATLGTGFDCASKEEVARVLSIGVTPERIIYVNPNKPVSHLKFAAKTNIDLMTVDSEWELQKISLFYPSAKLLLRIRYDAQLAQCILGGNFGCNPNTEAHNLIKLSKSLGLNMIGICFHVGTECFDKAIEVARQLFDYAQSVGYRFNLLGIGGGFPGGNSFDLNQYALIVNRAIDSHFPSTDVTIIAEQGRYYVASAFTLACQVHSKREIRQNGKISSMQYFINDGMFGSFACTRYQKISHPLTLKSKNEDMFRSTVWGPTMAAEDLLYENILLPQLNIDDFIIFGGVGAYFMALATEFNGLQLPKVEYYIERSHCDLMEDDSFHTTRRGHIFERSL